MAQSSMSGMQAMASGGMPGTSILEGGVVNGNGTSEPMSTSARVPGSRARRHSARKTIGGMPTPPPTRSARGRSAHGVNGRPIGPSRSMRSPARCRASRAEPLPITL